MGQINLAKKFIKTLANFCNAKFVKFQKRDVVSWMTNKQYNLPHPNPKNTFGSTYGDHKKNLN